MIQVVKPRRAPAILRKPNGRGSKETRKLCRGYDRGQRSFEFDRKLYGAKSVKNALKKAQQGKCCFCESKILHVAHGDVEHFRPKGGYRQTTDGGVRRPGYYWLAYDWSNLFLSCQICNQRHKRDLFPLQNPSARATSHHKSVDVERPLFVDPSEEPERHIGFRQEYAFASNGSRRGRLTIKSLGLNRTEVVEMRRDALDTVRHLADVVLVWEGRKARGERLSRDEDRQLQRNKVFLRTRVERAAQYSGMMRAAIDADALA